MFITKNVLTRKKNKKVEIFECNNNILTSRDSKNENIKMDISDIYMNKDKEF